MRRSKCDVRARTVLENQATAGGGASPAETDFWTGAFLIEAGICVERGVFDFTRIQHPAQFLVNLHRDIDPCRR